MLFQSHCCVWMGRVQACHRCVAVGRQLGAGSLLSRGSRDRTWIIERGEQMPLPSEHLTSPLVMLLIILATIYVCFSRLILIETFWSTSSIFCHSKQKAQVDYPRTKCLAFQEEKTSCYRSEDSAPVSAANCTSVSTVACQPRAPSPAYPE